VSFNKIICELALLDVISEPASPLHISHGNLLEGHALITVGRGGYVVFERTVGPAFLSTIHGLGRLSGTRQKRCIYTPRGETSRGP
jgi:hypothetical protein